MEEAEVLCLQLSARILRLRLPVFVDIRRQRLTPDRIENDMQGLSTPQ